ncbi:ATP-binding protein [Roseomonas rosulenta]|uniref:ATP-binding protein n=1 Tax=Roseomonas rosulenta TaxID=2748667 RepID=UPI0018DFA622
MIVLLLAIAIPLALMAMLTVQDRAYAGDDAQRRVSAAAAIAREHALRVVQVASAAIDRVDDATAGLTWAQIQARRAALQGDLRRIENQQPDDMTLVLVRPDGRAMVSGRAEPAPLADLSGLESIRALREGLRGLVFDPAPREIFGEGAAVLMARGRAPEGRPPDGALLGVLKAEAFLSEWSRLAGPNGRFALLRWDGLTLLRQGGGPLGTLAQRDPLRLAIAQGDTRPIVADPFGDGAAQLVAWQRVGDLPLFVAYAVPLTQVESTMVVQSSANAALAMGLALTLLFAGWRIWIGVRTGTETLERLQANAAELRAEIARREVAEESLRNAQRMEGLGRLTGGVAHDFNNLLTAILGTARALERHLGSRADERTKRLLAATVTAVDRGARLNASLLAFARRQPLTLTNVDANALLRDFMPLLRRALDESVSVELALDQKLPACSADAAQLEAALLNLAINARDAMPRGGKLRVLTRRAWLQEQALAGNAEAQPGPYVAIEVRDTGTGMPPEVRERAFEPFFTTKGPGQGTGLGLSQVFGFVRQIGGHVAIQSTPGRGTTVTLYLPLGSATEEAVGGTAPPPRIQANSGVGWSVLVVEDEPAVRAVAVDMLQDAGFAVLAAPDGPTALALLKEGAQADILFSDVVMPGGMTGVDLAREARRLRPSIGVLLASGYAAEALAEHGGAGEFEIIGKPYDVETVLTRIAAQRPRRALPSVPAA